MKNQTKPTSHFLGISLNNKLFSGLFNSLQKYLKENNLENIIELQNLSSLHITLYYFDKNLDSSILLNIKNDLKELNKNIFPVYIDQVRFFQKDSKKYLCYLSLKKQNNLTEINSFSKNKYSNQVEDNINPYIPHITLFKIKDFSLYKDHEKYILSIINTNLEGIKNTDIFKKFNFYTVDSSCSPEKQRIIL